jgi:hypothetical protein
MEGLSWNDVPPKVLGQKITEDDFKNADAMSKTPVGLYLCTCVGSKPKQINPKDESGAPAPSYFVAGLKWKIDQALELNGKPVTEENDLAGKFIFDDIALFHENEKEAMRNRRVFVAKRLGLITKDNLDFPRNGWSDLVIGKQALVKVAERSYTKAGEKKTINAVAFDGYDFAHKATQVTAADFSEI